MLPENGDQHISHETAMSSSVIAPSHRSNRLGTLVAPLRFRRFRLLLIGQAISMFGDTFFAVALPWLLLTRGAGASALGLVLACIGVTRVAMTLCGGVLSDRLRPRRVMLWSDGLRALLMGLLAALVFAGHPPLWEYCGIGALLGACGGVFMPAANTMVPDILPDDVLQAGNAIWATLLALAVLIGPGIAGLVVSHWQPGIALAVDAASYVVSALTLVLMRPGQQTLAIHESAARAGNATPLSFCQFLRTSRLVQVTLIVVLVSNLMDGGLEGVALPALTLGPFHAGAVAYGALLAVYGAGALVGGLSAGLLRITTRRGLVALSLLAGDGLGMILLPYLGGVVGAGIALAVWGLANGLRDVLYYTLIQQIIPRHLLGRLMGVVLFVTFGVYPLSVGLIGVFVARFGPMLIFPIGGVVMFTALLMGLCQREIRQA